MDRDLRDYLPFLNLGLASVSYVCYRYIVNTHNTKKTVYHILSLDFAFSTALPLASFAIGYCNRYLNIAEKAIGCAIFMLTTPLFHFLQHFMTFSISCIRLKTVSSRYGWKPDEILNKICNLAFSAVTFYYLAFVTVDAIFKLRFMNFYNICLEGIDAFDQEKAVTFFMIRLPTILITIAAFVMDFECWKVIKSRQENNRESIKDKMSLKATVISSSLFVANMAFAIFNDNSSWTKIEKYNWNSVVSILVLIIRLTLIVFVVFRANEQNKQLDKAEERERKRQIEIQEALQKREERKKAKKKPSEDSILDFEDCDVEGHEIRGEDQQYIHQADTNQHGYDYIQNYELVQILDPRRLNEECQTAKILVDQNTSKLYEIL